MEDEYLQIRFDYWDDFVGAFEPSKVLRLLQQFFTDAEIDSTDHQRVQLLREIEHWSQTEMPTEQRESLVRQSWGNYQTNGPTYRFVILFAAGRRVSGWSRRLTVGFRVPVDLPAENREQLLAFLRSLRMGEPVLSDAGDEEPGSP